MKERTERRKDGKWRKEWKEGRKEDKGIKVKEEGR